MENNNNDDSEDQAQMLENVEGNNGWAEALGQTGGTDEAPGHEPPRRQIRVYDDLWDALTEEDKAKKEWRGRRRQVPQNVHGSRKDVDDSTSTSIRGRGRGQGGHQRRNGRHELYRPPRPGGHIINNRNKNKMDNDRENDNRMRLNNSRPTSVRDETWGFMQRRKETRASEIATQMWEASEGSEKNKVIGVGNDIVGSTDGNDIGRRNSGGNSARTGSKNNFKVSRKIQTWRGGDWSNVSRTPSPAENLERDQRGGAQMISSPKASRRTEQPDSQSIASGKDRLQNRGERRGNRRGGRKNDHWQGDRGKANKCMDALSNATEKDVMAAATAEGSMVNMLDQVQSWGGDHMQSWGDDQAGDGGIEDTTDHCKSLENKTLTASDVVEQVQVSKDADTVSTNRSVEMTDFDSFAVQVQSWSEEEG